MPDAKEASAHLTRLRKMAGLTVRELARQIGTNHPNVLYWEKTGRVAKTEFLLPMAKALGVTVEEILGAPKPRKGAARGRMAKLFAEASALPKGKQDRISIVLEDMLAAAKGN